MTVYKDARFLAIITKSFARMISEFKGDLDSRDAYWQLFTVLHDIKYMQRVECMPYCVSETRFIEGILTTLADLYFADTK
jgi:hypothetical protein